MDRFARMFLRLTGWQPEGERPAAARFVLIAAPHTSNWDLAFLLALARVFGVRVSWMGKHVLFRPPLGWLMRRVGGIPVVRSQKRNMVGQMVDAFARAEQRSSQPGPPGGQRSITHTPRAAIARSTQSRAG